MCFEGQKAVKPQPSAHVPQNASVSHIQNSFYSHGLKALTQPNIDSRFQIPEPHKN